MKIEITGKYFFKKYNCEALLSDFSKFDSNCDKVFLHEEVIEDFSDNVNINEFEPLIAMASLEGQFDENKYYYEVNDVYILDGHHRWNYAVASNQIQKLKCIFVDPKYVRVFSYIFELNCEVEIFNDLLSRNKFTISRKNFNTLRFENDYYSSPLFKTKFDLYKFKREIQNGQIIKPASANLLDVKNKISFAPLEVSEIISLKHLLPPKSTWITPRL